MYILAITSVVVKAKVIYHFKHASINIIKCLLEYAKIHLIKRYEKASFVPWKDGKLLGWYPICLDTHGLKI